MPEQRGPAGDGPSHPWRSLRGVNPTLYGLDIETDTTVDGLDPRRSRVIAVALAGLDDGDLVVTGPERTILEAVDELLAEAEPGVIVTWNGASFDLPFIADRAAHLGVSLGLRLQADDAIDLRHPPLTGHGGAYRARWHDHDHLDAYLAFRATSPPEQSGSLKAVAAADGLAPVLADGSAVHLLTATRLDAYVRSDAVLARDVATRRWGAFAELVDGRPAGTSGDKPASRRGTTRVQTDVQE